jgi:hypothetical protein
MPDVGGPISGVGDDLTTDPPVSEAQRKAMHAAASGESNIGIPQSVGKEFVESIGEGHDQTTGTFLDSLRTFLRGLLAWAGEEGQEAEHAPPAAPGAAPVSRETAAPGTDREDAANPLKPALTRELRAANDAAMALDKDSVRSKDVDGRLHVDQANISKATVNPYRGEEIPDWEQLGLDPKKTYELLRDPDELAKAAKTFNNLAILSEHVPISAQDHPPELVIGSTGTDARFEAPYLKNSLVFWPQAAIDAIESGQKRELSCGYRYTPDMRPGVYQGQRYDGIMRDIVGNHVCAVAEGRAGSDVVVGDSKPITKEETMLTSIPAILAGFKTALKAKPKFAMDADIDEILPLLQTVLGQNPDNGNNNGDQPPMPAPAPIDAPLPDMGTLPSSAVPMGNQDEGAMVRDIRARDAARRLGRDETPEEKEKREKEDEAADAAWKSTQDENRPVVEPIEAAKDQTKTPQPDLVTKSAMDAALKAMQSTMARTQREIREAERAVFPYVGELTMSFDSKDQVYATALSMRGIDPKPIHPSAYPALLAAQPKAGASTNVPTVAMDAASTKGFLDRFPETKHIRQI